MRKLRALLAFLLIVCTLLVMMPKALAEVSFRFEAEAFQLNRLGLYTGISQTTFMPDLGAKLDRQLGTALLLNFFGKKNEIDALSKTEVESILLPYTDQSSIAPWARPYMAYAVKSRMIMGTSLTTLGPLHPLDGKAFATMILRQMGYTIEGALFAQSLEVLCGKSSINSLESGYFDKTQFLKDDAVGLVYLSLYSPCPDGTLLIERLIETGVVSEDKAFSQKLIRYNDPNSIVVVEAPKPDNQQSTAYDQAYYMILDAMTQGVSQIKLSLTPYTDTAKEVFAMIDRVVREHPEILYYTGCTYSSTGNLTLQYNQDAATIKTHTRLLTEKVNEICQKVIQPGMTDYQKEKAIHDYVVDNCEYDLEGYRITNIPSESYSAYGALCLGKAVCEGYAEAMMLLLNRSGVECQIITGSSRGEGHAWNLVSIEGDYYHLDATWDDPIMADGSEVRTYHYFNLNDQEMALDHSWNQSEFPSCKASVFSYYSYQKLIAQSQEEFINQVTNLVRKGQNKVSIKIIHYKTVGFDIDSAVSVLCQKLYRPCRYSFNEEQGIADLSFD